jgi:hypothetical protein
VVVIPEGSPLAVPKLLAWPALEGGGEREAARFRDKAHT